MKKWKYDIWQEGKYLDWWSLTHILAGGVLAGLSIFIGLGFWMGLLIAFLILLSWEFYEVFRSIEESFKNRVMDMIIGIAGFLIAYPLFLEMVSSSRIIIFVIIFTIFLFLELWGFIAYKKRNR